MSSGRIVVPTPRLCRTISPKGATRVRAPVTHTPAGEGRSGPQASPKEAPLGTRLRSWRAIAATIAASLALLMATVGPVAAITDGTPDGDGHPYVGLMTAHAPDGDY